MDSTAVSTSASVLNGSDEEHLMQRVRSGAVVVARKTCDGSGDPVRQAEPAEQQSWWRSNRTSAASDSPPAKERFDVLGRRASRSPFTKVSGTFSRTPVSKPSRIARTRVASSARDALAHSAAFPSATIDATFSVPARRLFSWLPPINDGLNAHRLLT